MQVLYPTYTLRIEVKDVPQSNMQSGVAGGGYAAVAGQVQVGGIGMQSIGGNMHKWFNPSANKIGCDEILAAVRDALVKAGIPVTISFEKFEHR